MNKILQIKEALHEIPDATTPSRTLAKIPLRDLQKALTALFRVLLTGKQSAIRCHYVSLSSNHTFRLLLTAAEVTALAVKFDRWATDLGTLLGTLVIFSAPGADCA